MAPKKKKQSESNKFLRLCYWIKKLSWASRFWILFGIIQGISTTVTAGIMAGRAEEIINGTFGNRTLAVNGTFGNRSVLKDEVYVVYSYSSILFVTTIFNIFFNLEGIATENFFQLLSFIVTLLIVWFFALQRTFLTKDWKRTEDSPVLFGISAGAVLAHAVLFFVLLKEFGWYIYRMVGADPVKRKCFLNLTLFRTFLKLDLFLHALNICSSLWIYDEKWWEYFLTGLMGAVVFFFTVSGLITIYRENKALSITFLLVGLVSPAYSIWKIFQMFGENLDHRGVAKHQPHLPSLLIIIGCLLVRIAVFITGIIAVCCFGRGLKEALEEKQMQRKKKGPRFVGKMRTKDANKDDIAPIDEQITSNPLAAHGGSSHSAGAATNV